MPSGSDPGTATHWIEEAELCVERAEATFSESELEAAAIHLRRAFSGRSNSPIDAETRDRLQTLRQRLVNLQATARHAEALYTGLEQLDPASVVGYTPAGLERAL